MNQEKHKFVFRARFVLYVVDVKSLVRHPSGDARRGIKYNSIDLGEKFHVAD